VGLLAQGGSFCSCRRPSGIDHRSASVARSRSNQVGQQRWAGEFAENRKMRRSSDGRPRLRGRVLPSCTSCLCADHVPGAHSRDHSPLWRRPSLLRPESRLGQRPLATTARAFSTPSASGTKGQQFGSILPQPLALVAPTWTPPLDKRPEALRVVRDAKMTELMHNDVIEHLERR
jgi:hypothetical protein